MLSAQWDKCHLQGGRWLALQYAVEDPQRGEQIIDHLLIERDLYILVLFFERNVLGYPVDHNVVLLIDAPAFGLEAPSVRRPMALKGVGEVDHLVNHHLVERCRRKVETRRYGYGGPHTLAIFIVIHSSYCTYHFLTRILVGMRSWPSKISWLSALKRSFNNGSVISMMCRFLFGSVSLSVSEVSLP